MKKSKNLDWEMVKMLDFCDFQKGTEPGSKSYNREGLGTPFIRVGNVAAKIQEQIYTTSRNIKLCEENDVLFTLDGSPGVVVRGFKGAYSSGIRKVIIKKPKKLLKDFVYFVLQTDFVQKIIRKYTTGVTIKHASKSLEHIKIPLPSLFEQQKIVYVLDSIQEAVEVQEKIIEKTKELKKSMMKHLFTYGPVSLKEAKKVKLKETETGKMPEKWEVVRLGDKLETLRNGITKKQNKVGKGLPVSRIETISMSEINPQKIGYVEGLTNEEIEKYKLIEGDILFSHINSEPYLGNSAVYENNPPLLIHGMNLLLLRTKQEILNSRFLNYLFNLYREKGIFINIASRAVNQSSINQGKLKLLHIPLPPLPQQQKIADILQTVDQKIEIEQKKKALYEELFKSILNQLMSGKLSVKNLNL